MNNPFALPSRAPDDHRPLCPWAIKAHENYYVAVDHSQAAYEAFTGAATSALNGNSTSWAFLIHGPQGCGKTALVHRCAYWLRASSLEGGHAAHIVDLTGEGPQGVDTSARVMHVCRRLVDKVGMLRLFDKEAEEKLQARRDEPEQLLPFLADMLELKGTRLIILTPPLELAQEMSNWGQTAKPYMALFCESSYDIVGSIASAARSNTVALEVGHLVIEDAWSFVSSRLGEVSGDDSPVVDCDTVRLFMEKRIAHKGRATIYELQRTCAAVFATVISQSRNKVTYEDFQDYYWGM